ncbi:hypothetical protein PORY_001632 [Pneumocystis oryctolagi]|uniref:Uncharacterized protein n=1 Tax=Pneumocystis oryctolagi TaxID=42067 RepID=A0ACB7CD02_9ASCO|nr:hypothetical protein PORY_001632 [Pneumocystis oryctolagi]
MEDPLKTSLSMCKNYHHFKSSVDSYLKSTYHEYAMEHVETMRPYLESIQKNANKYGKPVVIHIKNQYTVYAHPYVLYTKDYIYQYIQKHIKPIAMVYFEACNDLYTTTFKKYVIYFENIYQKNIYPSIRTGIQITHHFYKSKCITFYRQTKPYIIRFLKSTFQFFKREIYPRFIQLLLKLKDFFFTYIVPKFNLLWKIHVKPQLERIHNRIFQYKEIDPTLSEVESNKKTESFLNKNFYSEKNSEISKIKNKIVLKNNILKEGSKDAYYDINDIKTAGKIVHAKALEIKTYLKSIENDSKKKIIKKAKLSFNQIIMFQSEMVSLFEVFIKSNIKDEDHKKIYNEYFDFETLINTIEKQFFNSVLNSTLSSIKRIHNLSIKAEITLNNIVRLAARQLKDFRSVNASNIVIEKLYNDSVDSHVSLNTSHNLYDQEFISDNYEQKSNNKESKESILNTKSQPYVKVQDDLSILQSVYSESSRIDNSLSHTYTIHLEKESVRKMPWRLSRTRKLRQRRRLRKVDLVISTLHNSLSKAGLTCHALERHVREITPEAKMLPKDKYTVFSKKEKKYRKGIHFVKKVRN